MYLRVRLHGSSCVCCFVCAKILGVLGTGVVCTRVLGYSVEGLSSIYLCMYTSGRQ